MRKLVNISRTLPRPVSVLATDDAQSSSATASARPELMATADGADQLLMALASISPSM